MFDPAGPVLLISALKRELAGLCFAPVRRKVTPSTPRPFWSPLRDLGARAAAAGVGRARAEAAARSGIAHQNPRLVVSIGYCGALDPTLKTGDVLTADAVLAPNGMRYTTEPLGEPAGTLATVDGVLLTAAAKGELRQRTGAAIADMEAAGVAAACAVAGVPFAAVKVVTDAAGEDLPAGLGPFLTFAAAGGPRAALRCGGALLKRPALIGDLFGLARTSRRCSERLAVYLDSALQPPARTDTEG